MVESPKTAEKIITPRHPNPIQQTKMDGNRPNRKKSLEIRFPSPKITQSIKDQKEKTLTFQKNQLWNVIV